MKLDYTVHKYDKKDSDIKNKTKLSMQNIVSQALASKLPTGPANPVAQPSQVGWGSTK